MPDIKAQDPLTHREKVAIRVLLVIFAVVKPFDWGHEVKEQITELKKILAEAENAARTI